MTILLGPVTPPPRTTMNSRAIFYFAFVASIFSLWTVFAWYEGLFEELKVVRQERDAAVSLVKAREHERTIMDEELNRLKVKYGEDITDAHQKISELNSTGSTVGYVNFPLGGLEGAEDIVVAMKTGATEIFKTVPVHFGTTFNHVPNYLIFSDHEQQIGPYQVQDSLDESSEEAKASYEDFQLYRDQQKYMAMGQNPDFLEFPGGWELDKYKNVHILAKTYRQHPNAKWYVFIDADTYLVMANLVPYLRNLDHTKKLYFGSPTYIADMNFAHGGTGYVISQAAVKVVVESNEDVGKKFESLAKDSCCGDFVVAKALQEQEIGMIWANPNFQGEPPYKIELDKEKICEPILTLHHMLPRDISEFWAFEREKAKRGEYILFADVFERFVDPYLQDVRRGWDNMAGMEGDEADIEKDYPVLKADGTLAVRPKPFERCKKACMKDESCVQFRVTKENCMLSRYLMLGWKVPSSESDREDYKSGWLMDRVSELKKSMPCQQPPADWPKDKIK